LAAGPADRHELWRIFVLLTRADLDQGLHTSWATVRDTLKTHQICTIVLPTNAASCLRSYIPGSPLPIRTHAALFMSS
jgi:hypothetical protein